LFTFFIKILSAAKSEELLAGSENA
jgi:hypothetical protein